MMQGHIQNIDQLEIEGRRIFLRVDCNVPMREGAITDIERIEATIPTIKQAINRNAHVILLSHLGRPKGRFDKQYSLRPVARLLSDMLRKPIRVAGGIVGDRVMDQVRRLGPGEVMMLENVRFHPGESTDDVQLAKELARMAEVYINDAFGVCHRKQASVHALPALLEEVGVGLLVEKELTYLREVLEEPRHPFVAIFGGAKVEEKITAIRNTMARADHILIGGGMAYTFLAAQGYKIGKSIVSEGRIEEACQILEEAESFGVQIHLPLDHVEARRFSENARESVTSGVNVGADRMGMDIGPKTAEHYASIISEAQLVLWNGPMGVFEWDQFSQGTVSVAKAVGANRETTIVGGGDSIAALRKAGVIKMISHVSTGGGAMLSLISGDPMPGLDVLTRTL